MTQSQRRSTAHTVAAVLIALTSLVSVLLSLPSLFAGAAATDAAGDQPPFVIIIVSLVLGVIGLVSTYGVWVGQRWGVVLAVVIQALNFLSGAPGVIFGPTTFLVVGSIVGCVLNVLVVYLLLRRTAARTAPSEALA